MSKYPPLPPRRVEVHNHSTLDFGDRCLTNKNMKAMAKFCFQVMKRFIGDFKKGEEIYSLTHYREIYLLTLEIVFEFFSNNKNMKYLKNKTLFEKTIICSCNIAWKFEEDNGFGFGFERVSRIFLFTNKNKDFNKMEKIVLESIDFNVMRLKFYHDFTEEEINKIYEIMKYPEIYYWVFTLKPRERLKVH